MMTARGRGGGRDEPTRDAGDRALFSEVGAFLAEHRLSPSPPNYAVAYAFVMGSSAELVRAVRAATYGGLRLSQSDVDGLVAAAAGDDAPMTPAASVTPASAAPSPFAATPGAAEPAGAAPTATVSDAAASMIDLVNAIDQARDRFERYAGIVDSSRQDAQAYGAALASEAATMAPAAASTSAPGAVAVLLALTESMVAKTRIAEEQLREASVEMDGLRANLAAARQDAETDPLTGLPNRRAFEACFAERTAAAPSRSSLALCDIDLFKGVNDRYGHDVGDRVIRLVANELAQGCDGAIVARYGGEEFIVLFEGLAPEEAVRMLDRTRAALSRRSFRIVSTGEPLDDISFSGGVVAIAPGEACRAAVKRADNALYRAKQGGRNRIELGG